MFNEVLCASPPFFSRHWTNLWFKPVGYNGDMSGKWEASLPKKDLSKCIEGSLISLAHRMFRRLMVFFQTGPIVFHNFGLLFINDRLGLGRAFLRV